MVFIAIFEENKNVDCMSDRSSTIKYAKNEKQCSFQKN